MKIGIIGLPMSGKTSLFRLLTGAESDNAGAVQHGRAQLRQTKVEDARLDRLQRDYRAKKITPAVIDFLDFPPLDASTEAARRSSAELLAPAREAGALILVVRAFESSFLPPLRGKVDPRADYDEIFHELVFADLAVATGRRERIAKGLERKHGEERKALEAELLLIEKVLAELEAGRAVRGLRLAADEQKLLRSFQFLSAKPLLVVENCGEQRSPIIPDSIAIPLALELELDALDPESRAVFQSEYRIEGPSRARVISAIYERAGLISFLTAGEQEARAWTIPAASAARGRSIRIFRADSFARR